MCAIRIKKEYNYIPIINILFRLTQKLKLRLNA